MEVDPSPSVLEKGSRFSFVMTKAAARFSLPFSLMALVYDDHKQIKRLPDATRPQARCHHPAVRKQIPNQFGYWLLCRMCDLKMAWVPTALGAAVQVRKEEEARERVRQQMIRHRLQPRHMEEGARRARAQRQQAQGRVTQQQQRTSTTTEPQWLPPMPPPPAPPSAFNLDEARRAGQAAHQASIGGTETAVEYLQNLAAAMTTHLETIQSVNWPEVLAQLKAAREETSMVVRASQEQTLLYVQASSGLCERLNHCLLTPTATPMGPTTVVPNVQ